MKLVYTDNNNTFESKHWTCRGYEAWLNSHTTSVLTADGRVWTDKYNVYRPKEEQPFTTVSTLSDAQQVIKEDISSK